jgi:hypothetical protein
MPRVVGDVNSYASGKGIKHLSIADVYVGLSRVKCMADFRIFPMRDKGSEYKSFEHLYKKVRDPYYSIWRKSIDEHGYFNTSLLKNQLKELPSIGKNKVIKKDDNLGKYYDYSYLQYKL